VATCRGNEDERVTSRSLNCPHMCTHGGDGVGDGGVDETSRLSEDKRGSLSENGTSRLMQPYKNQHNHAPFSKRATSSSKLKFHWNAKTKRYKVFVNTTLIKRLEWESGRKRSRRHYSRWNGSKQEHERQNIAACDLKDEIIFKCISNRVTSKGGWLCEAFYLLKLPVILYLSYLYVYGRMAQFL
jgi:hypothetical protein